MKKILLGILVLFFITGCSEKKDENRLKELSLDNEIIEKIVNKFKTVGDSHSLGEMTEGEIYEQEELTEMNLYWLARINSTDLIKYEKDCKHDYFEHEDYYYQCEYIDYDDFNNTYKSLSGKNLPKKDIEIYLINYVYDSENNIYKLFYSSGGGGTDLVLANKLVKAEQVDEYIYIYEKVAFIWPMYDHSNYIIKKRDGTKVNIGNSNGSIREKALQKYLDSFDTYKWTFKKSLNGEYVYDSLSYVSNK